MWNWTGKTERVGFGLVISKTNRKKRKTTEQNAQIARKTKIFYKNCKEIRKIDWKYVNCFTSRLFLLCRGCRTCNQYGFSLILLVDCLNKRKTSNEIFSICMWGQFCGRTPCKRTMACVRKTLSFSWERKGCGMGYLVEILRVTTTIIIKWIGLCDT